jgi:hypothetical protein
MVLADFMAPEFQANSVSCSCISPLNKKKRSSLLLSLTEQMTRIIGVSWAQGHITNTFVVVGLLNLTDEPLWQEL